MSSLYDIPRQFLIDLAENGRIHYTFIYAFVVNGFLCARVIGPLLGGMGTMVVAKRMAFFSQAVGNAALTGVASAVFNHASRDDRAHQPVEHIALHRQYALRQVQLVLRSGREVVADVLRIAFKPFRHQLTQKLWRYFEAVAAKQTIGNQRHCFALLGSTDRRHRQA